VLFALSTAGALVIAAPAAGYAQGASIAAPSSQVAIQQDADNGAVDDQTAFIRTAVSDAATEIEAARLAEESAADPTVRQFAALLKTQYEAIMQEAADVAEGVGVDAQQAPTDDDERALIADLSTLSGEEFDETYLRAFVHDQRVTLADYLAARDTMDGDVSEFADRYVGKLSDQLRAALELADRLDVAIDLSEEDAT
jgi:predicted outer membrane protein